MSEVCPTFIPILYKKEEKNLGSSSLSDLTSITPALKRQARRIVGFQPMLSVCCQFSRSVVSDSLRPHGLQRARPSCPSPTPGVYSNSCPLSWWCHLTISSSVVPVSSRVQSLPASGSFQMSQFFTSGGQVLEFHLHQFFQWKPRADLL